MVKLFNLLDSGHLNIIRRLSLKDALINFGGPEMERQIYSPGPRGHTSALLRDLTCKSQGTKEVTVAIRPHKKVIGK